MAFNFRGTSVPDGSITTAKLADNAVTTPKISANAVDTTKVTIDLATQHFLGSETTLTETGTIETSVADFNFITAVDSANNWKKFGYAVKLQSDNSSHTATMKLYIDTVQYGSTVTTTATTPTLFTANDIDISALSAGSHHFEVKLTNTDVAGVSTLSFTDIFFGKQ